MRKILLSLTLLVGFASQAVAADNYAATAGSGLTFGAKDAAGVLYSRFIGCDNTTVSQCWSIDSSGRQLVTITSGSVASGAFASGSVASGAFASGSLAAGAMVDLLTMRGTVAAGTAAANSMLTGCVYNSTPITLTNGQQAAVQCSVNGYPSVVVSNSNANGQATMANSSPVVIASNQSAIPVTMTSTTITGTVAATQSGTWTVQPGNTANTTPWLTTPAASATGGATGYTLVAANTNNSTSITTAATTFYSAQTGNINSTTPYYLKLYNKASAPTCGTDTPVAVYLIPPNNSGNNITAPVGKAFSLGLGICVVTGIANNDNTAVPASTVIVNIDYK